MKNLFDVAGLTTLAGSRTLAGRPPAARDATLVSRLCGAGAVLVGALNMDALAAKGVDAAARAVAATRGEILTYEGRAIRAIFHAACGGHTASAALSSDASRRD